MTYGFVKTLAAAALVGTLAVGCSKAKQEDDAAAQPTHNPATPPTTPAMSGGAMGGGAMGTVTATTQKANTMVGNMGASMAADAQKMSDKMHATTMPAMPSMGH